jgi:hypothetical protein
MMRTELMLSLFIALGTESLAQGLVPPRDDNGMADPQTRLSVKDNDKRVALKGERLTVTLPQRSFYQWKPLPPTPDDPRDRPREIEELRQFVPIRPDPGSVGGYENQVSTFQVAPGSKGPYRLELVFCVGDPAKAPRPQNAPLLYKPAGDDLSKEENGPRPNQRFVVTLERR